VVISYSAGNCRIGNARKQMANIYERLFRTIIFLGGWLFYAFSAYMISYGLVRPEPFLMRFGVIVFVFVIFLQTAISCSPIPLISPDDLFSLSLAGLVRTVIILGCALGIFYWLKSSDITHNGLPAERIQRIEQWLDRGSVLLSFSISFILHRMIKR
jgi:hypothetical protein